MPATKPVPEGHKKKLQRDTALVATTKKAQETARAAAKTQIADWLKIGQQVHESYEARQVALVNNFRNAKEQGATYVPAEPAVLLVIRIKGINALSPKPKKILRLLRLLQLNNAVFLRNNKATMNMLRVVEPWVTYGIPNRKTISSLIYKRGYGKINGQRIPLSSNFTIKNSVGVKTGITCTEQLIQEIETCGEHFKEANNFLWPFKLNSPLGGLKGPKNVSYLNNGEFGTRDVFINEFVRRML